MTENASRLRRFAAALIDGAVFLACPFPLLADKLFPGESGWQVALALLIVETIAQLSLLVVRGQSLGKWAVGLRIVALDGGPASLPALLLVRTLADAVLCAIPYAGGLYLLVDSLCVFRADRRCLHDLMAGTRVVRA